MTLRDTFLNDKRNPRPRKHYKMAMKLLIKPLEAKSLSVESKPLFTPPLESLKEVLEKGLKANFDEVDVNVVTSPDLTQEPFNLASEGKSI